MYNDMAMPTDTKNIIYSKLVLTVIAALYFYYCAVNPTFGHFIDNVDLIIHEAGHWIFMFFGEFIYILGGSLTQVLVPTIFSSYFFLRRDYFSASFILFWVGYNIVNVSIYMGDSIVMQLPLLGGDSSIHDWNYLLTSLHILKYTNVLSSVVHGFGMFVMVAAAALCVVFSIKQADMSTVSTKSLL